MGGGGKGGEKRDTGGRGVHSLMMFVPVSASTGVA